MKLYRIAIVALLGVFASLQTVNAQSIDEKLETAFQIVTSSTKIDKQTAQGIMNILVPLQDQLDDAPDAQKTKYTFCRMVAAHYAGMVLLKISLGDTKMPIHCRVRPIVLCGIRPCQ